jgi:hypothetical protein
VQGVELVGVVRLFMTSCGSFMPPSRPFARNLRRRSYSVRLVWAKSSNEGRWRRRAAHEYAWAICFFSVSNRGLD